MNFTCNSVDRMPVENEQEIIEAIIEELKIEEAKGNPRPDLRKYDAYFYDWKKAVNGMGQEYIEVMLHTNERTGYFSVHIIRFFSNDKPLPKA